MRVVLEEQRLDHQRLRVLAQFALDKDQGKKVFDEYTQAAFPWVEQARTAEESRVKRMLDDWVKGGPVRITPVETTRVRSALAGRVREVDAAREREVTRAVRRQVGNLVPRGTPPRGAP